MIKKGQNFRVFLKEGSAYKVVAKATNATITYTGNTEDVNTKDDVMAAAKPNVMSKGCSIQVESLDVTNMSAILTAMKNATPFDLAWDEVSTTNNQTPEGGDYPRTAKAYLNDATFTFDDRANATKQIQFTVTGAVNNESFTGTVIPVGDEYTKGQYVRLFLASDNNTTPSDVIAFAKQLSVHVSVTLEEATTKDTEGLWLIQEQTGITFDITSGAVFYSSETVTSPVGGKEYKDIQEIFDVAVPVKFQVANVSGANNRTKGAVLMSGAVVITQLELQAQNRSNITYSTTLSGYGIYNVGA